MRTALYTFLLLVLGSATISAQQEFDLQLYFVDAGSNDALPFVNVQVSPSQRGGTSDENGKLNLTLPEGRIVIRASFLGYEAIERSLFLERDIKLDILMVPEGENLETVIVTDQNARELIERPTMGVEQLSAGDIKSIPLVLGELDVLKGLQLLSGVSAAGEASNGVSIRGGTIDQNLTLLDGAPVFTPTHLFGLFSVFTPDAVGGVNLYRANVPARYGGRIASVIDVRTRNPVSDRLKLQGGIGLVSSNLSIETPISSDKRLKMLVAGRVGINDFLFNLVDRLKNTQSRFSDATLKLRYTASENSIFTFSSFFSSDFYQVDLINTFGNINSPQNQFRYLTLNGSFNWLRLFSDRTSWQTWAISGNYRPDLIFPEEESSAEVTFSSQINQLTFRSELRHQIEQHQLSFGVQADRYRIQPGNLDPDGSVSINPVELDQEQGVELSAYVEDEWKATDRLTLSAGLRFTQYLQLGPGEERSYLLGEERRTGTLAGTETFGSGAVMQTYNGFEPRLGLNYLIGKNTSFKAAYALSRQYLQNIYNATTPLPTSRWKVSDINILPQRAELFSGGLYHLLGEGKYKLSLEAYYRKSFNVLEYKPGADFFLEPQVELELLQGEGEAYGIEFSIEKTQGRWTGQINYAYARTFNLVDGPTFSTRINDGNQYPGYFDQPHTFNANLILDKGRTHELGFNLIVQSNRPYSVPNGFLELNDLPVPLFLERNNARLPVYHRLDFSWTIHNFKREKRRWVADWVLTIYNVYGRNNAYNIFFAPRESPNSLFGASPLGSYQLSIFTVPVFSLSYKFTFQ